MVAYEHFSKFTYKQMFLILFLSLLSSLIIYVGARFSNPSVAILISLACGVIFMNLAVYLIQKSGSALFFYLFLGFFTMGIDDVGITGWEKVIVYLFVGLIFEIMFLLLKLRIHLIPLDIVLGSTISTASIILFGAISLFSGLMTKFPLELVNLILVAAFTGLFSSTLTFIVWHSVSSKKSVLKFKNYVSY